MQSHKKMIVHHPRKKRLMIYPNEIPGMTHVDKLNILEVTISDTLTFHNHVDVVVEKTARSFYAIKTIRAHGLTVDGNSSQCCCTAVVRKPSLVAGVP